MVAISGFRIWSRTPFLTGGGFTNLITNIMLSSDTKKYTDMSIVGPKYERKQ